MSNLKFLLDTKVVIKLGGTSQTKFGYDLLISKLSTDKTVIVVSAMKGITNKLFHLVENFNSLSTNSKTDFVKKSIFEPNIKLGLELGFETLYFLENEMNYILLLINKNRLELQDKIILISMGETFTAKILNKFLEINKINSNYVDSSNFIECNLENVNIYNKGEFTVKNKILIDNLKKYNNIVVPGFRGTNIKGDISLMGRGGSDTTGSIIAASLNSSVYQIWTDVNGIYSGDPNNLDNVNIINSISYDAAQEISAMGAQVIHPYCIKPCKKANIPIEIRNTFNYDDNHTIIKNNIGNTDKLIYSITSQKNVTVFKIESLNMWNNYGFVYDIFSKFKYFNVDVNIINTSQFNITTTTDDTDIEKLERLKESLQEFYNVNIEYKCSCVSIVGENIKKYDKLNNIMNKILSFDIKLTSYSSNDMTLSFIVDTEISNNLVKELHQIVFPYNNFKITNKDIWWNKLLSLEGPKNCKYLYNLDIVKENINKLKSMDNINRIYYAMKANNNESVLKTVLENGLGIETVSVQEISLIVKILQDTNMNVNILFTPNFVSIDDYLQINNISSQFNIITIIDNLSIIEAYPEVFRGKELGIRLDLDYGFGHCNKVITQGQDSKFGVTPDDILSNLKLLLDNDIKIVGLHSHMGSGITDYKHWVKNMKLIVEIYNKLPESINKIEWFNIGGGFGIGNVIDFNKLNLKIGILKKSLKKDIKIFIEPGRIIVAESGIIWGKVTQLKVKNNTKFIGTNIGMTDLIRPVLYSAIHPIYFKDNINQIEQELVTVVGPICESGDVLIKNLMVNNNIQLNDSLVVTNTGAYGHVMASKYNNRELPEQIIFN
jgi:bifunctional diaminopimelate decarboxylase / aspartate kinase